MPSSRTKREKRGFDTIPQLFSGLRLPIVPLLEKTDDFEQQGNAKQRQSAADHIRLIPGVSIPSGPLVLIDDVLTTGSTLRAAQALLPQAHEALVLAVINVFCRLIRARPSLFNEISGDSPTDMKSNRSGNEIKGSKTAVS